MSRTPCSDAVVVRLADYEARKGKTLSDLEQAIDRAKRQAVADAMAQAIASLDPEDGSPQPCPSCSCPVRVHTRKVQRTISTLHGELTLTRQYHYCRDCGLGFYPRDAELGLPSDGALSLEMERRILDFAVSGPYNECAERWNVHYPHMPVSANQFRQVCERVGKRAERADRRRL
jgi:hypothetical protein